MHATTATPAPTPSVPSTPRGARHETESPARVEARPETSPPKPDDERAETSPSETPPAAHVRDWNDTADRYEMIAEAAYFKAEKRGFALGDEELDWLEAEQELIEQMEGDRVPEEG